MQDYGRWDAVAMAEHGLIYEPDTGMCRSDICAGESLTALKIDERDGTIFLIEKHGRCHITPA